MLDQLALWPGEDQRSLKPFWRYYGGKWRSAPLYPQPRHDTVVELFAGAAGYACRYPHLRVILVERYAVVASLWRYLITASPEQILEIPLVEHVDDLPAGLDAGARALVGFRLTAAGSRPNRKLSSGCREMRDSGVDSTAGWGAAHRLRVAQQVSEIRHWRVIEDDWTEALRDPELQQAATWFVDPPYNNRAGAKYTHGPKGIDYDALGATCRALPGQVIACENAGATWLPFRPFGKFRPGLNPSEAGGSREVIWTNDD